MIVVDASVAVKWFLPEHGAEAAHSLLLGHEKLVAPTLIRIEVAAAITRKVRLGELPVEDAEATCDLWLRALLRGVVTLRPDEDNLETAVKLALQIRHPLQDCLYLALAQRDGGSLITADPKFAERAGRIYPNVELLRMKIDD
jgi:predicted nucleic acid-binding protein